MQLSLFKDIGKGTIAVKSTWQSSRKFIFYNKQWGGKLKLSVQSIYKLRLSCLKSFDQVFCTPFSCKENYATYSCEKGKSNCCNKAAKVLARIFSQEKLFEATEEHSVSADGLPKVSWCKQTYEDSVTLFIFNKLMKILLLYLYFKILGKKAPAGKIISECEREL